MLIFTVDSFTDQPFAGNPAPVCVLDSAWPATDWLQQLAAELNQPSTTFVRRVRPRAELRWFSPHTELALSGSSTLAAAHVLWQSGERADVLEFDTRAGVLGARREPDGRITLDFPADELRPVPAPPALAAALGAAPVAVWRGRLDLIAELDSARSCARWPPIWLRWPSSTRGA